MLINPFIYSMNLHDFHICKQISWIFICCLFCFQLLLRIYIASIQVCLHLNCKASFIPDTQCFLACLFFFTMSHYIVYNILDLCLMYFALVSVKILKYFNHKLFRLIQFVILCYFLFWKFSSQTSPQKIYLKFVSQDLYII